MAELAVYDNDPTLYLFTSLTAGSSHIITATSRIETILKANKIPFKGVDTATDDLARKLFQRRASGKKLPLLVREGYVLGDLEMIEEWNEYDELKEALGFTGTPAPAKPAPAVTTASASSSKSEAQKENAPTATSEQNLAIRQLGAEAAKVAAAKKPSPANISTTNPLLTEKVNSPAATTPKLSPSPSGVLSPRSIPLPGTPQRPSMAPSPSSTGSGERRSFHGAAVEDAPLEEIKKWEQKEAIAEVSSSEEEDSEDERERHKSKEAAATAAEVADTAEQLELGKLSSHEGDAEAAKTADEVADTAEKLDAVNISDKQVEGPLQAAQTADEVADTAEKLDEESDSEDEEQPQSSGKAASSKAA